MEMKSIFVIDAILIIILLLLGGDTLHGLKGQIQEKKQRRKLFQYFRIIANNQNCLLVVITSKEGIRISFTLNLIIKHSTLQVTQINIASSCSVHPTKRPIWIVRTFDHQSD
ncbi:hypothetical protein V1477_001447 [Vespula maculifrons]|uniref:Secreted protein n=1 Tax=Vespula maculifrons TaxID=7453 RepID=A0ABD2CZ56_VESMC